jgi:hypothetical protein
MKLSLVFTFINLDITELYKLSSILFFFIVSYITCPLLLTLFELYILLLFEGK